MQFVDKQDDLALRVGHFFQESLEAIFEFSTVLGASDHCADVHRNDALILSESGTSPLMMRRARPSAIAVLPTPGSPISTGLFFVRRESTGINRRISLSRPITGSILPRRANSVRSRPYFSRA